MTEPPSSRGDGLSSEQVQFLIESGAFTTERLAEVSARVARGDLEARERKSRQGAIDASLTTEEVAEHLRVDATEVRRRKNNGCLYAFVVNGEDHYPTWQFTDDPQQPTLPGLALVIEAFPAGMHAATIRGFMSTPQRAARIDGTPVTPVDWLLQAGDPQTLQHILAGFLQT